MNDKPISENLSGSGSGLEKARYPLAESISKEALDAEVRKLEELKIKPYKKMRAWALGPGGLYSISSGMFLRCMGS